MKQSIAVIACAAVALLSGSSSTANASHLGALDTESKDATPRRLEALAFMATMTGTTPSCTTENSYDYVGNDIANKRGDITDCCNLCLQTERCTAWSWNAHLNGTCWLKGGRGAVVYNPDVVSSVVLYPGEPAPCAKLDENIDYVGNDIANVQRPTAEDCCAVCNGMPNCHAFTHTSHNGGTCWLKSQRGRMQFSQGARSSVTYSETIQPQCGLELGVDYVGNDISNAPGAKPESCCGLCRQVSGCRAFSWTNQNGGTCYFKNRKDGTVAKTGVTSAAVFPNPPVPSCVLESGITYAGNDIGNVPGAEPTACCSICMKTASCKAFSWSNLNGGTCWLKSMKLVTRANTGVYSAVV